MNVLIANASCPLNSLSHLSCTSCRPGNLNFLFRLSLKFYGLGLFSVARCKYPNDQRPKTSAVFTASPKSSNGTGHESPIAEMSRPGTARTALSIERLFLLIASGARFCRLTADCSSSCWPGARQVPDDMRRAITTPGLASGMACSGWV